ncbi:MAG: hypothetical protein C4343_07190 [Chloroflexota bacterium]
MGRSSLRPIVPAGLVARRPASPRPGLCRRPRPAPGTRRGLARDDRADLSRGRCPVEIHLVDATYELFRAHYAPRPPVQGRDGHVLNGVVGLVEQLLALTRDEGATHVGCATDRVVESFRNDRYPRYKSSAGVPDVLLAQFPIAEAAIEALGFVVWPMVAFEAGPTAARSSSRHAPPPQQDRARRRRAELASRRRAGFIRGVIHARARGSPRGARAGRPRARRTSVPPRGRTRARPPAS